MTVFWFGVLIPIGAQPSRVHERGIKYVGWVQQSETHRMYVYPSKVGCTHPTPNFHPPEWRITTRHERQKNSHERAQTRPSWTAVRTAHPKKPNTVKKSLEFDYPRLQGGALRQIHGCRHRDF